MRFAKCIVAILIMLFSINVMADDNSYPSYTVAKQKIEDKNKDLSYNITMWYPKFDGTKDIDPVNDYVQTLLGTIKDDFIQKVQAHQADAAKALPTDLPYNNSLTVTYDVTLSNYQWVSVRFTEESYFQGAAHPIHQVETFTYDFKQKKMLTMGDMFEEKTYLNPISSYCYTQLVGRFAAQVGHERVAQEWIQKGTAPKAENYKAWNITDDGLVITFQDYQVLPYAFGRPEVFMTFKQLHDDFGLNITLPTSK